MLLVRTRWCAGSGGTTPPRKGVPTRKENLMKHLKSISVVPAMINLRTTDDENGTSSKGKEVPVDVKES